jgi:hypothetical protein
MAATTGHPTWRIVPLESDTDSGRRHGALAAEDAHGCTAAVALFDGPATGDTKVELALQLGPVRPPVDVVGELVRSIAVVAAEAGADRLVVDFDPECQFAGDVLAASGLDWRVRGSGNRTVAEVALGVARATSAVPEAGRASVVRAHPKGVTILASAEGPSLRSDPRWTAQRAHRSERLLERLVSAGRSSQGTERRVGRQTDTITGRREEVGPDSRRR